MHSEITTAPTLAAAIEELIAQFPSEYLDTPLCELPDHLLSDASDLNIWSRAVNDCHIRIAINNGHQWGSTPRKLLAGMATSEFTFDGETYETREALTAAISAAE